jgi:hypothetical protein
VALDGHGANRAIGEGAMNHDEGTRWQLRVKAGVISCEPE